MEFAESTDKEKPIPKELTAFLNEVQNNLGLYPETVIYNRIKEYIPVIPRKQIAWLTQTVIVSPEFRVRILNTRCKSGDKLACEMLDLNIHGDPYSKNPTVQKGLMGLFKDENNIESGNLLLEIGAITQEQYDKEIGARKKDELIDGKSYPDLLNDLAAESKKYPTADSFSMAMIMGKLESVPSPNTANVYKLIRGKYKSAEDFYNAVKKGEFELKKTEERKERMAAGPEEVVSKPLVVKGVEDLELMKKEIKDKIDEEKRRRARGGGMAGEPAGEYPEDNRPLKERYSDFLKELKRAIDKIPPREKGGFDRSNFYAQELNRLRKKYNIPTLIPKELMEEVEGMAGEINEPQYLSKAERLSTARAIALTASGPVEQGAAIPVCPQIPGFIHCTACKFKYSVTSVISCPYRPEQTTRVREDDRIQESPEDYKLWTFADFEPFIYNEEDIDELGQLQGIVNLSNRLTETEKTELHELIDKQIGEILARR